MDKENRSVEIRTASNGFVVIDLQNYLTRGEAITQDSCRVFQTFAELVAWLENNFTHRAKSIQVDKD